MTWKGSSQSTGTNVLVKRGLIVRDVNTKETSMDTEGLNKVVVQSCGPRAALRALKKLLEDRENHSTTNTARHTRAPAHG